MVYMFGSTSKITFPGSGVAALATSPRNVEFIKKQLTVQTIGHDKINQLRHTRFFKNIDGIKAHMEKHADILRPKFEAVLNEFDKELAGLEIGSWIRPVGGYFISFDALEGCAKKIVAMCKDAGVVLTGAVQHIHTVKIQKTAISVSHHPSHLLRRWKQLQRSLFFV